MALPFRLSLSRGEAKCALDQHFNGLHLQVNQIEVDWGEYFISNRFAIILKYFLLSFAVNKMPPGAADAEIERQKAKRGCQGRGQE